MWRINQLRKPWSAGAMKISCARQYLMRQEFPHRQDRKVYQLKWWRYSMLQCFLLRRCQVYAPHIKPGSARCCSMFGSLVDSANTKTATFPETSSNRLADWRPGQEPLKELLTWFPRILNYSKQRKCKGCDGIHRYLVSFTKRKSEQRKPVETKCHPHCWRCKHRCRFCRLKRKEAAVPSLRSE